MTFEQIFNVESAVERAIITLLGADNCYEEFSDGVKKTPGYEVKFAGEPTGKKRAWKDIKLDCEWRGVLETRVVTTRFQNSDQHAALLVRARIELSRALYIDSQLPFHWITYVQEKPLTRAHDRETGIDTSTLHHELVVSVRDECWLDESQ
jgi:hypothetical protein